MEAQTQETATIDCSPIQMIINDRAEKRLKNDISSMRAAVTGSKLNNMLESLSNYSDVPRIKIDGLQDDVKGERLNYFFSETYPYMTAIKALLFPLYIQEETQLFVQQVSSLQYQLDNLKNGYTSDYTDDLPY